LQVHGVVPMALSMRRFSLTLACPALPRRSYLYVRMLCNPQLYGVPFDALDTDPLLQVRAGVQAVQWCDLL
jgi:hypothetical protein